ncbi:MAG: RHS repeat-associated core domain-containing protein, partial [Acidobacteriota bacterium]
KGTAPPNTVSFDQTTNRVNSAWYQHDANGNMTAMPGYNNLTYDIDNRLLSASGNGSWEQYAYLADNKRVWKQTNLHSNPVEQYYLYGVGGERIATYTVNQQMLNEGTLHLSSNQNTIDVYFGGRLIWQNGQAVLRDRLGSVMARRVSQSTALERHDYFPYGEERTPSIGDRNKFGTYHRDQTGLDYADQRYYNSAIGRFLSADPYEASGGATEPTSWGRGVYVHGDPVNWKDSKGLFQQAPEGQPVHWCPSLDRMVLSLDECPGIPMPVQNPGVDQGTIYASFAKAAAAASDRLNKKIRRSIDVVFGEGTACGKFLKQQFGSGGGSIDGLRNAAANMRVFDISLEMQSGQERTISDLEPDAYQGGEQLSHRWARMLREGTAAELVRVTNTQGSQAPGRTVIARNESLMDYLTLAHEALHYYTGLDDSGLAQALLGNRPDTANHQAASGMIDTLLRNNCDPSKVP